MRNVLFFSLAAALWACTSSSGNTGATSSGETADSGPIVSCDNDPRVDTYVANLVKKSASGKMQVTLVASDPAPPIVGNNSWTLKVTDDAGAAMTADVTVATWMPDHGHTASVKPAPAAQPDGSWKVGNLDFFMGGVWRITITHDTESVQYFFCVDG
jgi:hypothetical protein